MTSSLPDIVDPLDGADGLDLEDLLVDGEDVETHKTLDEAKRHTAKLKRSYLRALNNEKIAEFLRLPEPGEAMHIVSNGNYDYFFFVTNLLRLLGNTPAQEYWAITWTMHESAVMELLRLIDAGLLPKVHFLTSTHFKNTKSAFAAQLIEGFRARGMRYRALKSHAKIMCLAHPPHYLVLEGSANMTRYPGCEQNVLINDKGLFDFHTSWMEDVFSL
jgi:hypothetical protein